MNLAPNDSVCSLVSIRISVASTTAPNLFAVAIACKPATPTPNINTLDGVIVPAAVIIKGNILVISFAPNITDL